MAAYICTDMEAFIDLTDPSPINVLFIPVWKEKGWLVPSVPNGAML